MRLTSTIAALILSVHTLVACTPEAQQCVVADAAPARDSSHEADEGVTPDGSSPDTGLQTCEQPILGVGSLHDGTCTGGLSVHCAWDEACTDGLCTKTCRAAGDCRRMVGCLADGRCGPCVASTDCPAGQSCLHGHCLTQAVRVFELIVDPAQWQVLLGPQRWDKTPIPCSLTVAGVAYPGCTVRPRGQSSLAFDKFHFRIAFPEDADHPGYSRKINLRAEYNDPSFLRLVAAGEAFRRLTQIPTPRTRYVRLVVNGEHHGVYVEYERIGGKFLERHRRSRALSTYEADAASDEQLASGISALITLPDSDLYPDGYDKKTGSDDEDYSDLIRLIEQTIADDFAGGSTCGIRKEVNLELLLDYLALMGVLQNDDYGRKNYYFSRQQDRAGVQRWEFYPWDLDLTFGCFWTAEHGTLCQTVSSDGGHLLGAAELPEGFDGRYPLEKATNLLIYLVAHDPQLADEVTARICRMIDTPFWRADIFDLVSAYEELLLPEVAQDVRDRNGLEGAPDPVGSEADFRAAVDALRGFITDRTAVLSERLGCP